MTKNIRLINTKNELKLEWTCNVQEQNRKYKNKDGTEQINRTYKASFPQELISSLNLDDNKIYFYKHNDEIRITFKKPETTDSKQIKIQKRIHYFSIPVQYFNVTKDDKIILSYNLLETDPITGERGILTIHKQKQI